MRTENKPLDGRTQEGRNSRSAESERPQRPSAGREGQLFIPKEYIKPGYVPYLALDKPGNIEKMVRRGWEFIEASSDLGFLRSESATQSGSKYTIPAGGGKLYYGMQIRQDWYDEMQEELLEDAKESHEAMEKPNRSDLPSGAETYLPDGRKKVITNT